jgi:glycosyltransferase involved in cell wall biosynthesis
VQGGNDIPNWVEDRDDIIIESTPALDLSNSINVQLAARIRRRVGIHQSDFDDRRFLRKVEKHILEFRPNIILPVNSGVVPALRRFISKNSLKAKIIVVGQAGLVARLAAADAFVALTSRDYEAAKLRYPQIAVFKAHSTAANGVDFDLFCGVAPDRDVAAKYSNFPKPIVLCVSALVEYKRVDLAIRAVSKIEGASLIVLGDGPRRTALNNLIETKVQPRRRSHFLLLGDVPFAEMPTYYAMCDVFVHPADATETTGGVIVEAMAMGKPVVVNDDPVRREIVETAGYLVDPTVTSQFSNSIVSAFNSWDSAKKEAVIEQAKKYSWDNLVEEYISWFKEVIDSC